MPYQSLWRKPELALEYAGQKVYRTYRYDDFNQGRSFYWFTMDCASDDDQFDVRDLDVPGKCMLKGELPDRYALPPQFASATAEQLDRWQANWNQWLQSDQDEWMAIQAILCEAIDLQRIAAPAVEADHAVDSCSLALLPLLQSVVGAKLRFWNALRALEKAATGNGEFSDAESDAVLAVIDGTAATLSSEDELDSITVEDVDMITDILEQRSP